MNTRKKLPCWSIQVNSLNLMSQYINVLMRIANLNKFFNCNVFFYRFNDGGLHGRCSWSDIWIDDACYCSFIQAKVRL